MSKVEVELLRKEYEYYSGLLKRISYTKKSIRKNVNVQKMFPLDSKNKLALHSSIAQRSSFNTIKAFKDGIKRHKVQLVSYVPQSCAVTGGYKRIKLPSAKGSCLGLKNNFSGMFGNKYQHWFSASLRTRITKPFVGKYALKRVQPAASNGGVSINKVLGRRISNLSKNKYKFVNAHLKPQSKSRPRASVPNFLKERYAQNLNARKNALTLKQHLASRLVSRSSRLLATQKSNKFCLFFNKFGRCHRGTRCPDIHDPDKISICTRFLRGKCLISNCPFSHKILKEKMPTCKYFLKGACLKSNCPYRHVNVGRNAEVCKSFIEGHCALGNECKKKHVYICTEYSTKGVCSLGNSCPMHHVSGRNAKSNTKKGQSNQGSNNFLSPEQKISKDGLSFILLETSLEDQSKPHDSSFFSDIESWSILPEFEGSASAFST